MEQLRLPLSATASEIAERFQQEHQEIQDYVALVQNRVSFSEPELVNLARILEHCGLLDVPVPESPRGSGIGHYGKATHALLHTPAAFQHRVAGALDGAKQAVKELGHRPSLPDGDWSAPVADWVDWMAEELRADSSAGQIAWLREQALRHMQELADEYGDRSLVEPEVIEFAIQNGLHMVAIRKVDDLIYAHESMAQLAIIRRMQVRHATIHILRQGFILLMTALDAAVFDLLRVALRARFFDLIGQFGGEDRIQDQRTGWVLILRGIQREHCREATQRQVLERRPVHLA